MLPVPWCTLNPEGGLCVLASLWSDTVVKDSVYELEVSSPNPHHSPAYRNQVQSAVREDHEF